MAWGEHQELRKSFQKYGFKAGFLKLVVLKLVSQEPTHGYALMKRIEELTETDWCPSPGSIYPALQELEKEELITVHDEGRRRLYAITPKGEEMLKMALEHAAIAMKHLQNLLEA